jgi:hypothetical protein
MSGSPREEGRFPIGEEGSELRNLENAFEGSRLGPIPGYFVTAPKCLFKSVRCPSDDSLFVECNEVLKPSGKLARRFESTVEIIAPFWVLLSIQSTR